MTPTLQEYRCTCGKLLFKGLVGSSIVEIKCRRCDKVTSFGFSFSAKSCLPINDSEECKCLNKSLKNGTLYKMQPNAFLLRDGSKTFIITLDVDNK